MKSNTLLLLKIQEKASQCTTAEEARKLYVRAPSGSEAEEIYEARWAELHLDKN